YCHDSLCELADKALHPVERLFDVGERCGVGGPHMTRARFAEGRAWHDGYLFFHEQALGELLVGEAGRLDGREGVECAARLEAVEAQAVEAIYYGAAAAVVLLAH